jgi:hypothetical protein
VHFDPSSKNTTQLDFHTGQGNQTHSSVGLKFDEHIDVAFGREIIAQHGTEERQLANPMPATEGRNLIVRNTYLQAHDVVLNRGAKMKL